MFLKIKNKLEEELIAYLSSTNKSYSLNRLSPLLFKSIKEFILRDGKRIRPILFCIGYLGFSKKTPAGLYRCALSLELLHDFLLIHDDIIDKSEQRRGKPAMHTLFNNYFGKNNKYKFTGEDLAIVVGDVIYALALDAFLAVEINFTRKEAALKKLIRATLFTAGGEFIELLLATKALAKITQKDIYKIYDYKTANYTFASPLTMGATLAGANLKQINQLHSYGMLLGRAFQINDDIIGIFKTSKETGKSNLTDLQEAKRTLLVWYAFKHANKEDKISINKIMRNKITRDSDLIKMRRIIIATGALTYAQKQINYLHAKALRQISGLKMQKEYTQALINFSKKILTIDNLSNL